jgi:hypothetical protein
VVVSLVVGCAVCCTTGAGADYLMLQVHAKCFVEGSATHIYMLHVMATAACHTALLMWLIDVLSVGETGRSSLLRFGCRVACVVELTRLLWWSNAARGMHLLTRCCRAVYLAAVSCTALMYQLFCLLYDTAGACLCGAPPALTLSECQYTVCSSA